MAYRIAADIALVAHLAFILFALLGALLVLRWRRVIWLHVPAAAWAAAIELAGWICPLTYLENALRERAGLAGYTGGFVEHYLLPLIYPAGLTPAVQYILASAVLLVNVALYGWIARQHQRR